MSNPLYNQLNNNNNDMIQVIRDFQNFKKQMANINPQQEVMNLLQSGRINQQQLNQFQQMASRLGGILK